MEIPYAAGRESIIKINIEIVPKSDDESLDLRICKMNPKIMQLINQIAANGRHIFGTHDGSTYKLDLDDIYYIEAVERKVFVYSEDMVCEIPDKLYEIAERLDMYGFVRVSKSVIVNLEKMKSIRPAMGKFMMTLTNDEQILVSRQYIGDWEAALGIEKNRG